MASLTNLTVNGNLIVTSDFNEGQTDMTEWTKLGHCVCEGEAPTPSDCRGTGLPYLHVRTPIPADYSVVGWIPMQLEVVGYHTYSGEKFHDFTAIMNVNGYDNGWYGSQIKINRGNAASEPFVYRSTNSYGGIRRVCFSVAKMNYCGTGFLWARWRTMSGYKGAYPWATYHTSDSTTPYF